MLSIEKSIKEFEAYFQGNPNDVEVVSRTMLKNIEIHKEVNLYDTDWGNYNFKKQLPMIRSYKYVLLLKDVKVNHKISSKVHLEKFIEI